MIESTADSDVNFFLLGGLGLLFGVYNIYKVFSVIPKPINTNKFSKDDDIEELCHRNNIILTND